MRESKEYLPDECVTDDQHIAQFAEDIWGNRNTGRAAHPTIVELADAYLKLRDILRWREFPAEKPTCTGDYQIFELHAWEPDLGACFTCDHWNNDKQEWDLGNDLQLFWRPMGNLPPRLRIPPEPRQQSLFQD